MRKSTMLVVMATAVVARGEYLTHGQGADSRPAAIQDAEAYVVYASLIPQEWTVTAAHATRLVVQREAATYNRCLPSGGALETDWRPVVESFKAENARDRVVLPDRDLQFPYLVVPKSEIMALFQEAKSDPGLGWPAFYRRYPDSGGYMQLSAVGFDPAKTRALVYIGHQCGGLCGGGEHYLLQKTDGVWRPVKLPGVTQCIWAS
jgi:hypothetical protein